MRVKDVGISDIKLLECFNSVDERGSFIKLFNLSEFTAHDMSVDLKEIYYSVSQKNVIRGMHFQLPPYDHVKIVHVVKGCITDVLVDLRKNSKTYKQTFEFILSEEKAEALFIPRGFAHGFRSMKDNTTMIYLVSSEYNRESDSGIAFDSIGYDWQLSDPIISDRDRGFKNLSEFESPF